MIDESLIAFDAVAVLRKGDETRLQDINHVRALLVETIEEFKLTIRAAEELDQYFENVRLATEDAIIYPKTDAEHYEELVHQFKNLKESINNLRAQSCTATNKLLEIWAFVLEMAMSDTLFVEIRLEIASRAMSINASILELRSQMINLWQSTAMLVCELKYNPDAYTAKALRKANIVTKMLDGLNMTSGYNEWLEALEDELRHIDQVVLG